MNHVVIREANATDALGIARVHVKGWQTAYAGLMPNEYLQSLSIEKRAQGWKKQLLNPEEGNKYFVANLNNEIVGWCTAGKCKDSDSTSENGEIYGIYVQPEYIGKGIGTKLINATLLSLKHDGYTRATLWVLSSNERSKQWYKSRGWQPDGKSKIDDSRGFDLHELRYIRSL